MQQLVCLDGTNLTLDADDVKVEFSVPGLEEVSQDSCEPWVRCKGGEAMEPVARYKDGTTVYFHCVSEDEPAPGYSVESPRPHHWDVRFEEQPQGKQKLRVAMVTLRLD